jgi:hypothetical protein
MQPMNSFYVLAVDVPEPEFWEHTPLLNSEVATIADAMILVPHAATEGGTVAREDSP